MESVSDGLGRRAGSRGCHAGAGRIHIRVDRWTKTCKCIVGNKYLRILEDKPYHVLTRGDPPSYPLEASKLDLNVKNATLTGLAI